MRLGWRFALAAATMGALAWFLGQYFNLWILVVLSIVVYAALLIVLRAFSPDDIALFRQVWRPQRADGATQRGGD